jgi:hypothetical protein
MMFKYYTNVHYKFIETNKLIEKKYIRAIIHSLLVDNDSETIY